MAGTSKPTPQTRRKEDRMNPYTNHKLSRAQEQVELVGHWILFGIAMGVIVLALYGGIEILKAFIGQ